MVMGSISLPTSSHYSFLLVGSIPALWFVLVSTKMAVIRNDTNLIQV